MDEKKEAQQIQAPTKGFIPSPPAQEIPTPSPESKPSAPATETPKVEGTEGESPLEEARAINQSIKDGNEELKKLLDRQEKMLADSQIAGKGFSAPPQASQFSVEEKAQRARIKAVADASGSKWGEKYA